MTAIIALASVGIFWVLLGIGMELVQINKHLQTIIDKGFRP